MDVAFSCLLAVELGMLPAADAERVLRVYSTLGLPCSVRGVEAATFRTAVREITVHRDGLLRAPMPAAIGACTYAHAIPDEAVDRAFARLEEFIADHPETLWDRSQSFAAAADGAPDDLERPGS